MYHYFWKSSYQQIVITINWQVSFNQRVYSSIMEVYRALLTGELARSLPTLFA